jgi:hypothetical protein
MSQPLGNLSILIRIKQNQIIVLVSFFYPSLFDQEVLLTNANSKYKLSHLALSYALFCLNY